MLDECGDECKDECGDEYLMNTLGIMFVSLACVLEEYGRTELRLSDHIPVIPSTSYVYFGVLRVIIEGLNHKGDNTYHIAMIDRNIDILFIYCIV